MTWQGNLKVPESKKTCSCGPSGAADKLLLGEGPETCFLHPTELENPEWDLKTTDKYKWGEER